MWSVPATCTLSGCTLVWHILQGTPSNPIFLPVLASTCGPVEVYMCEVSSLIVLVMLDGQCVLVCCLQAQCVRMCITVCTTLAFTCWFWLPTKLPILPLPPLPPPPPPSSNSLPPAPFSFTFPPLSTPVLFQPYLIPSLPSLLHLSPPLPPSSSLTSH